VHGTILPDGNTLRNRKRHPEMQLQPQPSSPNRVMARTERTGDCGQ
jgi:hypothetical protein